MSNIIVKGPIIRGLLIDPEKRQISVIPIVVEKDGTCLDSMYRALNCSTVDCGRGGLRFLPSHPEDDVWFDDEGLYSDSKWTFEIPGWVPLVGRGLVLGFNDKGDCTDCTLTSEDIEELKSAIRWGQRLR